MARKQATIITCDNCKFLAEVDDLAELPRDWYHIALPNEHRKLHPTANGFDVCSLDCMSEWATKRKQILKELKTPAATVVSVEPTVKMDNRHMSYTKKKCMYCDKKVSAQGMRVHVRFTHPEFWEDWAVKKGLDLNKSFGKAGTKNAGN